MSSGLCISTLQEFSSVSKDHSRIILHSSDPPKSPLVAYNVCEAVENNGRLCQQTLPREEENWCKRHATELKDFQAKWNKAFRDAECVEAGTPDTAREKILKLRQAMDIRRQIREKFYSRGGDTSDFINWIASLEKDMRTLADSILSMCQYTEIPRNCLLMSTVMNLNLEPTPETPGGRYQRSTHALIF